MSKEFKCVISHPEVGVVFSRRLCETLEEIISGEDADSITRLIAAAFIELNMYGVPSDEIHLAEGMYMSNTSETVNKLRELLCGLNKVIVGTSGKAKYVQVQIKPE